MCLRQEALAGMRAAVTRALAIDDDLAEAHAARALLLAFHEWRLAEAEPAFRRALALNPGDASAHSWYAQYLIATGRGDEALAESRRAIELDPLSLADQCWVRQPAVLGATFRRSDRPMSQDP